MGKDLNGKELGKGICQNKEGLYVARFTDKNGKRQQKRFKKLNECKYWLSEAVYKDNHSDLRRLNDMSLNGWFDNWIETKKRSLTQGTVDIYINRYNRSIRDVIGNMNITDIKTVHIQQVLNTMDDEKYSIKTINLAKNLLHNLFEDALANDVIVKNPCNKSLTSNIGKKSDIKEAMTIEEQSKFVQGISEKKYEDQYRFILQTGLRTGEMSGLKWEDVDFDKRTIKINRSLKYNSYNDEWVFGNPKSKYGFRTISLTSEAYEILLKQKEKHKDIKVIPFEWSNLVFLNDDGMPVKNSTYDLDIYSICHKVGIKRCSMHILRHTFATRCIEAGMKPKTLQKILGHSNISVTMDLYVHIDDEQIALETKMVENHLKAI